MVDFNVTCTDKINEYLFRSDLMLKNRFWKHVCGVFVRVIGLTTEMSKGLWVTSSLHSLSTDLYLMPYPRAINSEACR